MQITKEKKNCNRKKENIKKLKHIEKNTAGYEGQTGQRSSKYNQSTCKLFMCIFTRRQAQVKNLWTAPVNNYNPWKTYEWPRILRLKQPSRSLPKESAPLYYKKTDAYLNNFNTDLFLHSN